MSARKPAEICGLFKQYMAEGDMDGLLSVYDSEVVFLNQAGEAVKGKQELRQQLAHFAAARARFDFNVIQVIESGDIALMHTQWNISGPQEISVYAIEVARRQRDGTWRWLIGDPFTIGRHTVAQTVASAGNRRDDARAIVVAALIAIAADALPILLCYTASLVSPGNRSAFVL